MKKILVVLSLFVCLFSYAQNEADVLRYSQQNSFTTARSAGMAGAFGGLGADLSSLSSNPAGLGLYRRGDFSFSPNFGGSGSSTAFNGQNSKDSDFHFKLNSIGFVTAQESEKPIINKAAFGLGYNQLANFNHSFTIKGTSDNSILDVFADQIAGVNSTDIYDKAPSFSVLAWDAFLIDTIAGTADQYKTAIPFGNSKHNVTIDRNGGMGEVVFGGGANVGDRFYWGLSAAIQTVNYEEEMTHVETPEDELVELNSFTYSETLEVRGSGWNVKAGVILKPSQKLRIGAAVHSPTVFSMTDGYSRGINAQFPDGNENPDDFVGAFNYKVRTPGRLMANIAFIAGKSGVISADYEYIDYSNGELRRSRLSGDNYNFSAENARVSEAFRSTHNVKAGFELRIVKNYRIRAGARYAQSPYVEGELSEDVASPTITYTGGFGYRMGDFYVDVAGIYTQRSESHYMYNSRYVNEAVITTNFINVITTLGWRF